MLKKLLFALASITAMLLVGCEPETIYVEVPGPEVEVPVEVPGPTETIYIMSVAGVTLNETETTLSIGETMQLTATVEPADATDPTVTWSNDNPDAVSIDEAGLVTALAYGTATITATAGGDNPKTASCTIAVSPTFYVLTMANSQPQLWINGKSQWTITDGSVYDFGYGSSMTVSGGDVYMAMNKFDSSAWTYWAAYAKNGETTQITDAQSYAYSMALDGSDIYVVGYQTDQSTWESRAMVWKNGEATSLGERSAYGYSVAVANGNVYVAGQQQIADGWNNAATVWTNGVATALNNYGSADKIVVKGSDVYVLGWAYDEVNWMTIYQVWKNGEVLYTLPYEGYSATVKGLAIADDGTVYVAGMTQVDNANKATLWTNGVASILGDAARASEAYDISIFNGDVYIVGSYDVGAAVGLGAGSIFEPAIWKNGEDIATRIELGAWASARAVGLSVQE
jgi:hypothetical protein